MTGETDVCGDEEESTCLIEREEEGSLSKYFKSEQPSKDKNYALKKKLANPGVTVSIRLLSTAVLVLLTVSHSILGYHLLFQDRPAVRRYRVNTNHTSLPIFSKASDKGNPSGYVEPAQVVELYDRDDSKVFHRIVRPNLGFVRRNSLHSGKPYFIPLDVVTRPLNGWWPEGKRLRRSLYAPTSIVVAQQLWNALQVIVLFLLIAANYCQLQQPNDDLRGKIIKWSIRLLTLVALLILPFTVYLVSPGAHVFAFLSFLLALTGMFYSPSHVLRLSIGEQNDDSTCTHNRPCCWILIREETLGCLCTLGSSLYNYAGSNRTWPHWKTHFYMIDNYFGWQRGGDLTVEEDFTFLSTSVRIPLFVPRADGGSTFGAQQVCQRKRELTCYENLIS